MNYEMYILIDMVILCDCDCVIVVVIVMNLIEWSGYGTKLYI